MGCYREMIQTHKAGLILHNLDLNEQAAERSLNNIKYYQEVKDHYNCLLSKISLSYALMGSGKLAEAKIEAESAYTEACSSDWKHVRSIAAICYANVLAYLKQTSIALFYYEEGISLSKAIGHELDTIYGQLWYSLALADLRDPYSALEKLKQIKLRCSENGFHYLESISATFLLIVATKLKTNTWSLEEAKELLIPLQKQVV